MMTVDAWEYEHANNEYRHRGTAPLSIGSALRKGQASEVMDRTLDKLLTYEAEQSQAQLDELTTELSEIEHKYGMTSDEFYRRFQTGQTDDRMDFVEWVSLVQMAANLR